MRSVFISYFNTDRMTHTVFDLVEYASNMMTLYPGDLISTGSPAGVGTARAAPVVLQARRSVDLHDRVDRDVEEYGGGREVDERESRDPERELATCKNPPVVSDPRSGGKRAID